MSRVKRFAMAICQPIEIIFYLIIIDKRERWVIEFNTLQVVLFIESSVIEF